MTQISAVTVGLALYDAKWELQWERLQVLEASFRNSKNKKQLCSNFSLAQKLLTFTQASDQAQKTLFSERAPYLDHE